MSVIPEAESALKTVRQFFSLSSYNPWFLNDGFQVSYSLASSLSVKLSLFLVRPHHRFAHPLDQGSSLYLPGIFAILKGGCLTMTSVLVS